MERHLLQVAFAVESVLKMTSRGSSVSIENVKVSAYTIPTDFPESDGTLEWNATTIVIAEVVAGNKRGLGYTYADTSAAQLIHSLLARTIQARDAMNVADCWNAMVRATRNLGRPGISSCAISAVDTALWDLKAKFLDLPLVSLFGAVRQSVSVYGSGGFTSYSDDQLTTQLGNWVSQGIKKVKMKIGRDAMADRERVKAARSAIGKSPELFVDANGAYSRKQALMQAGEFAKSDVTWFEEPVSSDDLEGLHLIRDRAPAGMEIAAGEYGYDILYFRRMLAANAVDVLQADATRCGGFTGFLQASILCQAYQVPLSAHTAPTLHAHVCCAATPVRHVEYFHDHARIERMLFEGIPEIRDGELVPDLSKSGLGIELKTADAKKFAA